MREFAYTVQDALGIHIRPAGELAKLAKTFQDTAITLTRGEKTVKLTQIMMLMAMAVKRGDCVTVRAEGAAEDAAIAAVEAYFRENL